MANTNASMNMTMTRETEQMMQKPAAQMLPNGWPLRFQGFPARCTRTLANNAKGQQGATQDYYRCDPDSNQCTKQHKTAAEATICAQKRLEKQGIL